MAIVFVGIDLAKKVYAVNGVNDAGKPELVRPKVARAKLHELIASLPPCTIGMEACSCAHRWARLFLAHGHEFKDRRQLSAWLGVVPGQYSSGGKTRLGRITKAGDGYRTTIRATKPHALGINAQLSPVPCG
jgi:transposase